MTVPWRKSYGAGSGLIDDLPELNRDNAFAAWRDYAEVIVCKDREEMAACRTNMHPNI